MKKTYTKEKIIKEAIDLFYERGFANTSIRDIVREVGVTTSTVYVHFENKDEILFNIINSVGDDLLELYTTTAKMYNDPIKCLREMIFKTICLVPKKRKEMKIYLEEEYQLSPELRQKALDHQRKLFKIYHKKISELKEVGLAKELDNNIMTFGIFAIVNYVIRWFRESGRLTIEEVAEEIISMFLSGILREGVYLGKD